MKPNVIYSSHPIGTIRGNLICRDSIYLRLLLVAKSCTQTSSIGREKKNIWKSRRIAIGLVTSCDMARRSIERAEHSLNIIGLHNIKKLLIFFEKKSQKLRGVYFSTRWISSRKAPHLHTRPGVVARVRTHTQSYIYIYMRAHTLCVYLLLCLFPNCFVIIHQPAASSPFFFFSVAPDRAPDLWFINYAIKKERERNGIHPRSFPMQLYQTNSTQRRFKWVLIYTAALCRKSWNFILLFELLFSRRGEKEREKRRQGCCIQSVMGPCHYCP